jgi:hypothetical protein
MMPVVQEFAGMVRCEVPTADLLLHIGKDAAV